MSFPTCEEDRLIVDFLRALPDVPLSLVRDAATVVARADVHGVGGLIHDELRRSGLALGPALLSGLDARALASELDYAAHLDMLGKLDAALASAGLRGVLLKGALLAQRLYARPSARATTDIDLLVDPADLDAASNAVRAIGYRPFEGPREAWFREHHHHLHFLHPHALPLELHFHAYRGFGRVLPSRPLLERSRSIDGGKYAALRVLAPEDELVYLAVHAASHRFARLAWLYDCKLLVATMSDQEIAVAAERAFAWGYARPLALAAELLVELFGVSRDRLRAIGALGVVRRALLHGIVGEPSNALLRSATRFVYTTSLSPTPVAAARYATAAVADHVRRVLGREA